MNDEGVNNYRLCLLDQAGTIQEELVIFAQDDDEAIDMAGSHGHPYEMKLWKGPRLVGHFPSFNEVKEFRTD